MAFCGAQSMQDVCVCVYILHTSVSLPSWFARSFHRRRLASLQQRHQLKQILRKYATFKNFTEFATFFRVRE